MTINQQKEMTGCMLDLFQNNMSLKQVRKLTSYIYEGVCEHEIDRLSKQIKTYKKTSGLNFTDTERIDAFNEVLYSQINYWQNELNDIKHENIQ